MKYYRVLSDNEKLEKIPEEGISSVRILRCANCPRVTMIPPTIFYRDIQEVRLITLSLNYYTKGYELVEDYPLLS